MIILLSQDLLKCHRFVIDCEIQYSGIRNFSALYYKRNLLHFPLLILLYLTSCYKKDFKEVIKKFSFRLRMEIIHYQIKITTKKKQKKKIKSFLKRHF